MPILRKTGVPAHLVFLIIPVHIYYLRSVLSSQPAVRVYLLNEQERQIIHMRYFQNQTQAAIAKKIGISQVQVSRMEKKILNKLRKNANTKEN